jgi:alcohol dehydrogenase (cytochrome c)
LIRWRFTSEQAARGQAAYARACVSCHGAALEGGQFGVALKGAAFESHWRGRTLTAFSEQIRTTMPPRGLGSVSGQAYSDIEAYILQVNSGVPVAQTATPPLMQAQAPDARSVPDVRRGDTGPLHQAALDARATKLSTLTPVTDAMLRSPGPSDWQSGRRTYNGHGYSPFAAIDRSNVAQLSVERTLLTA